MNSYQNQQYAKAIQAIIVDDADEPLIEDFSQKSIDDAKLVLQQACDTNDTWRNAMQKMWYADETVNRPEIEKIIRWAFAG